jgi:hypothetical protein
MFSRQRAFLLALSVFWSSIAWAAERFAIVLGSNRGASGRPNLWFAESDAEHFAKTLTELGELPQERIALIRDGSLRDFRAAFDRTETELAKVHNAGKRSILLVYFSGHADPEGLELRDEHLSYEELRGWVTRSRADVKVAIVDACDAGTLTQVKGARASPAVSFPLPGDDSVEGVAFVASTAAGESAQESAALGGSFFTHHLEVAMRGAGDADGDGRVTLAEAFRYASGQTVSGTFGTQAGPQHPTYALRMSGRGDVVLADLRRADAHLILPADSGARYILRGPDGLVAELEGGSTPLSLALPRGDYSIERRRGKDRQVAQLALAKGATENLPAMGPLGYELATRKGGARNLEVFAGLALAGPAIAGPTLGADIARFGWAPAIRLGAGYSLGHWNLRLRLEYVQSFVKIANQNIGFRSFSGVLMALFPVIRVPVRVELGPEIGYTRCTGTFGSDHCFKPGEAQAGIATAISVPLGPIRLRLEGDMQLLHLSPASAYPVISTALVGSYPF